MTLQKPHNKTYHHGDLAAVLLGSAEIELSENGIEAFSLRAVSKRAGVSHGAPAHHFTDVRGLLTALATIGYKRFLQMQLDRQNSEKPNPESQLIASGLGYIDFAVQNPALFRLMFSSEKPNRDNADFSAAANAAFDTFVEQRKAFHKSDPYNNPATMHNVVAGWAMAHGLADLMISGRLERPMGLSQMTPAQRDTILKDIFLKTITNTPTSSL